MTAPSSRFSFGLQRVLDLRQQREQAIAGRLGAAAEAAADARNAMDALAAVRDASTHDLSRAHRLTRAAGELHQQERVMASLDAQIDVARQELDSREAVVDEVRSELATAMQARRVISRLRERREEEWRQAFTRSERSAMDALAVERHARQSDDEPITGGQE
ncbi:MAG: flagellar export protein FliJ [Gemmatimonadales bacterium]|nr:flagellar export protein FliJ [Gemmatimonadota bacterium]MCL4214680.1 flagellar export protein FliJ [Gemmatimonadales bacterium]